MKYVSIVYVKTSYALYLYADVHKTESRKWTYMLVGKNRSSFATRKIQQNLVGKCHLLIERQKYYIKQRFLSTSLHSL